MKIVAVKSFSGLVTMTAGEEREVREEIAADLLRAGYAKAAVPPKKQQKGGAPDAANRGNT